MFVTTNENGGVVIEPTNESERDSLAVFARVATSPYSVYVISSKNWKAKISFYIPKGKQRDDQIALDEKSPV